MTVRIVQHLRTVLHPQAHRSGYRPRPRDRVRHRLTERRSHRGGQHAGAGYPVHRVPARGHGRAGQATPELLADADASIDGSETVLLVEDDARVRTAIRRFMSQRGYQVIEAADGDEATRLCEEFSEPLDIVVTDVRMPGLRGTDLARRVAILRPRTPILFISGYTDSTPVLDCLSDPMVALLHKPFTAEVLARKVRQMLSARRLAP